MAKKAVPYYTNKKGENTLEQGTHFARSVNHPGYKGDSYLGWAIKNVNVEQSLATDMRDAFKFGNGVIPKQ